MAASVGAFNAAMDAHCNAKNISITTMVGAAAALFIVTTYFGGVGGPWFVGALITFPFWGLLGTSWFHELLFEQGLRDAGVRLVGFMEYEFIGQEKDRCSPDPKSSPTEPD